MRATGAFIGAFFARLLDGRPLALPLPSRKPRQVAQTKNGARKPFRKAFLYRGIFSRVARDLGLTRSHVRRVALGERVSAEVAAALRREINRIEEAA